MADLTQEIETPTGKLKPGKRYNLTLKHGDSERELKNAKVIAFEHSGVSLIGFDDETIEILKERGYGDYSIRYEAQTKELTVGFLPENVLDAKERS